MPDPIYLDTGVLAHIANGDTAIEAQVISLRAAGHQLVLVPKVHDEVLYGNPLTMDLRKLAPGEMPTPVTAKQPSPAARARIQQLMKRLDITVDTASAGVPRNPRSTVAPFS